MFGGVENNDGTVLRKTKLRGEGSIGGRHECGFQLTRWHHLSGRELEIKPEAQ